MSVAAIKNLVCAFSAVLVLCAGAGTAAAATAVYSGPDLANAGTLSGAADGVGIVAPTGATLQLLSDTLLLTQLTDTSSIVSFASGFISIVDITFGSTNGGSPLVAFTQAGFGGGTTNITAANVALCAAIGGCDMISIETTFAFFSPGFGLDTVLVNGVGFSTVSPQPEPTIWALMIAGFGLTGWRLKRARRASPRVTTAFEPAAG